LKIAFDSAVANATGSWFEAYRGLKPTAKFNPSRCDENLSAAKRGRLFNEAEKSMYFIAIISQESLTEWKDLATIIGVTIALGTLIIGLITLIRGIVEYKKQGSQKRFEQFTAIKKWFYEREVFQQIALYLETDDAELKNIKYRDNCDFLAYFEVISLMTNSKLIRPEVVYYMLGYYAIRCLESNNFWDGINKDSQYWALFRDFAKQMKSMEQDFTYSRKTLRF
jgi:hypothetical protein